MTKRILLLVIGLFGFFQAFSQVKPQQLDDVESNTPGVIIMTDANGNYQEVFRDTLYCVGDDQYTIFRSEFSGAVIHTEVIAGGCNTGSGGGVRDTISVIPTYSTNPNGDTTTVILNQYTDGTLLNTIPINIPQGSGQVSENIYNVDGVLTDPIRNLRGVDSDLQYGFISGTDTLSTTWSTDKFEVVLEDLLPTVFGSSKLQLEQEFQEYRIVGGNNDSLGLIRNEPGYVSLQSSWLGTSSTELEMGTEKFNFRFFNSDLRMDNDPGTAGQVLTSNGVGVAPTWETIASNSGGDYAFSSYDYISNDTVCHVSVYDSSGVTVFADTVCVPPVVPCVEPELSNTTVTDGVNYDMTFCDGDIDILAFSGGNLVFVDGTGVGGLVNHPAFEVDAIFSINIDAALERPILYVYNTTSTTALTSTNNIFASVISGGIFGAGNIVTSNGTGVLVVELDPGTSGDVNFTNTPNIQFFSSADCPCPGGFPSDNDQVLGNEYNTSLTYSDDTLFLEDGGGVLSVELPVAVQNLVDLDYADYQNPNINGSFLKGLPEIEAEPDGTYFRLNYPLSAVSFDEPETIATGDSPDDHNCFPSATTNANGDILVAYREGDSHLSNDALPALIRSTDGGKTWSSPQYIVSTPATSTTYGYRSFGFAKGQNANEIFYFYTLSDDTAGRIIELKYKMSTDGGYTWGAEVDLAGMSGLDQMQLGANGITVNGRILVPVYGFQGTTLNANDFESGVIISDNNGASWTYVRFGSAADQSSAHYTEGYIVPEDGKLIALVRVDSNNPDRFHKFESSDNGSTWTDAGNIAPPSYEGTRADILHVGKDKYYMAYRNSANSNKGTISYTEDGGSTWTPVLTGIDASGYSYGSWIRINENEFLHFYGSESTIGGTVADVRMLKMNRTSGLVWKKVNGELLLLNDNGDENEGGSTASSGGGGGGGTPVDCSGLDLSVGVALPVNTGCIGASPNAIRNLQVQWTVTPSGANGAVEYEQEFHYSFAPTDNQIGFERSSTNVLTTQVYRVPSQSQDFAYIRDIGPYDPYYTVKITDEAGCTMRYTTDFLGFSPSCNTDTSPANNGPLAVWQSVNGPTRLQTRIRQQSLEINDIDQTLLSIKNTYFGDVIKYSIRIKDHTGAVRIYTENPNENTWIFDEAPVAGQQWTADIYFETTESGGPQSIMDFQLSPFVQ